MNIDLCRIIDLPIIKDPRGNLTFIASHHEDYWYLHVKLPHWENAAYYPVLIYSWDIVTLCQAIEEIHPQVEEVQELFGILNRQLDEGMNRMGPDMYWLGLYWRNNRYDLSLLKELCGFCLNNSVGKICITPWKSLIIKGIRQANRAELEQFLGQRGINIRHSQLEMNWHLPVDDQEALDLKQYLVRSFDQKDISTYGLTFGVSNDTGKRSHFSSVILEKNDRPEIVGPYEVRPTYNVLHFKDFDPNTRIYNLYAQEVDRENLPELLIELSKEYFGQLGGVKPQVQAPVKKEVLPESEVHQCIECQTVYDMKYGDESAGIRPGSPFEKLPDSYQCPVCGSPKSSFKKACLTLS